MSIHPTAIVQPGAQIPASCMIGPYCTIGPNVVLGEDCELISHVILDGHLTLGRNNRVYPFACVGIAPQDLKYAGEPTRCEIGDDNTIREYVTINRGTAQDTGVTRIGNENWIMAYVHFAHDCEVGSKTIFANCTQLAAHVTVEDWVIFGATTLVHQFVRIGAHAFTGMGSFISQDVPPYVMAAGHMASPYGINSEGLRRRGFSAQTIQAIKRAYRTLYRSGLSLEAAKRELEVQSQACPEIRLIVDFLSISKRGIAR